MNLEFMSCLKFLQRIRKQQVMQNPNQDKSKQDIAQIFFQHVISDMYLYLIIVIMLLKIAKQLVQPFSRSQNFFQMNPVFPDMGDKDFDLYNIQRKKIHVLDDYAEVQDRQKRMRELVRKKLYLHKYKDYKKFKKARKVKIDEETKLPLGLDVDLDDFVKKFKQDKLVTKNAKSQFRESMLNLVHKFNCKSEAQLIRLFRISMANSKKSKLLDKMRGKIMQVSLIKTSAFRDVKPSISGEQEIQEMHEEQFQKILKEIDDKIEKVEQQLRFDEYGIPKSMNKYDAKYGWEEKRTIQEHEGYDLTSNVGRTNTIIKSSYDNRKKLQDQSIRTRINRLYFLRRLQLLKKDKDDNIEFFQELPINLRQRQNIMNQIAFKYKQEELLQEPDLKDIYREVDIIIDKIFIKVSPDQNSSSQKGQQLFDKAPPSSSYLWNNLDAQEILCSNLYSYENIKNNKLSEKFVKSISPNPDIEVSLSTLPINLYRHSEFQIFGIYNEHRSAAASRLFRADQVDLEPSINEFTVEEATKQYQKLQQNVRQGLQTSEGRAKRKKAEAQVFITKGTGYVTINGKPIQDYFGDVFHRVETLKPLVFTDTSGLYDLKFNVAGGGCHGQSQCMAYALSRALMKINPEHKSILSQFGLVGYDSRQRESKKTNLYSARKRPPYVRR